MRRFLPLLFLPAPVFADTIVAPSTVTAVTIYPQGAEVTREVQFSAPAGRHDLRIADLPASTVPDLIRLASEETALGSFTFQEAGLIPVDPPAMPDLDAAISAAQATRDAAALARDRIAARIEAAEAQVGFLRGMTAEVTSQPPAEIAALSQMIGSEVLAAREAMLTARAEQAAADRVLAEADTALAEALAAREEVRAAQADKAQLTVAITQAADGEGRLTLRHFVEDAAWRPVYDATLIRSPAPVLTLNRGALISQFSGEDWRGVALTLSTARPSDQAAPSMLWPELRRAELPEPERAYKSGAMEDMAAAAAPVAEVETAVPAMQGDVVVYQVPAAVDLATGVADLRVALGDLSFTPEIEARAVPRADSTAFVMATFTNGAEILLPGEVVLLRDGTLVGRSALELTPARGEIELAFGAIDGLKLTRDMPQNSQGDAGFLSSDTARSEAALLRVENLTEEAWPLHVIDQIPYSEQDELAITYSATPAPTETDPDGARGLLGWRFDLAPGAVQEIALTVQLRWPEGMELR